MDRECTEGGEFVPTVTPERVLAVFEPKEPIATVGNVARDGSPSSRRISTSR